VYIEHKKKEESIYVHIFEEIWFGYEELGFLVKIQIG